MTNTENSTMLSGKLKALKIPRNVGNHDGLKEYCRIFPIFSNLEGKCPGDYAT